MADAVTSQTIIDGSRKTVMKFTNISDGTGESAVVKVDVSALVGAPAGVRVDKIHYDISGMQVELLWDATTPLIACTLSSGQGCFDFTGFGGLQNNAGAGKTGDIKLTTLGHTANDTYSIVLEMSKS